MTGIASSVVRQHLSEEATKQAIVLSAYAKSTT